MGRTTRWHGGLAVGLAAVGAWACLLLPEASAAPTLTAVTPSTLAVGQTATLVFAGTGFQPGAVTVWQGPIPATVPAQYISTTELRLVATATAAEIGTYTVAIQNLDGQISSKLAFTIMPAVVPDLALTLSSVSPSTLAVGQKATLFFRGTNFQPGASIVWRGPVPATVPASYVSSAELRMVDVVAVAGEEGTYGISVRNPDGQVSNPLTFVIISRLPDTPTLLPRITEVAWGPDMLAPGEPLTLVLRGEHFGASSGALNFIDGAGRLLQTVHPTSVVVQDLVWTDALIFAHLLPAFSQDLLPGETISVEVVRSDGQKAGLPLQMVTIVPMRTTGVPFYRSWNIDLSIYRDYPPRVPSPALELPWNWSDLRTQYPNYLIPCDGREQLMTHARPNYTGWMVNNQFGFFADAVEDSPVITETLTLEHAGNIRILDRFSVLHPSHGWSSR